MRGKKKNKEKKKKMMSRAKTYTANSPYRLSPDPVRSLHSHLAAAVLADACATVCESESGSFDKLSHVENGDNENKGRPLFEHSSHLWHNPETMFYLTRASIFHDAVSGL